MMITIPIIPSRALSVSLALLAALALSAGNGCASKPKPATGDQSLGATDEQIFIGDTIEKNYDPNVIIKRAESFFEKEDYAEAIIEYQHFLDLHKIHALAPYAQYRLGESHYMLVKTFDRDASPVTMALAALNKLLVEFPGSQWESDAREKIKACHTFMAQNAMFIGKFYYRRESYLAAANRFESIVKDYPDLEEIVQESLYYLAQSYSELALGDWAKDSLTALNERYPGNKFQSDSRKLMAKLNSRPSEPTTVASPITTNGSTATTASVTRQPQSTAPTAAAPTPAFR
ncbi:MAG: outer membrane protein assembly factor BamD [Nitrospiraceae bacterium]|nr:outer membrane protein assembly factor BamD [Nitrospiraceae bacterium]